MVAELERATNNNIEQLSLEFVMYTMLPYFRRIEEERRAALQARRPQALLRALQLRVAAARRLQRARPLYSILLQNGVFSRNEVRASRTATSPTPRAWTITPSSRT
jgi:phage portal protein BeeE